MRGGFTVVPVTVFACGATDQRRAWQALLSSLESTLRLRHREPGKLAGMAEEIYRPAGGVIGGLSPADPRVVILAIADGAG
ncbi:hypothetical protein [Actinomadura geliboluensis]|uniref:Uncharacterized protein n=1 Tax=Actinomadura geliboluensis TaxID=882440 RepID=A0A5S4H706_9ACTN|nr:hypothetical protein [Actinomadura geliboluensis]TMR40897.1 hypothetical protein ETD96_08435 [Actinomadura geliboluensis]